MVLVASAAVDLLRHGVGVVDLQVQRLNAELAACRLEQRQRLAAEPAPAIWLADIQLVDEGVAAVVLRL